ncbi:UDP-glycosyltransferase 83A1-like [Humulus lupulus]|uniref:UDP-glycosyltransferase 83A1-like n=1 Tax=Humulus lupulus TaxID=3486 RepID=UPI002B40BBFE|nr:UDP-glycosyltransferase 83A1-like [Humulus lupulus]
MTSVRKQRVMMVPAPAQGHVKPLMIFAQKLAQHGFRITFVYTEYDLKRILSAMSDDDLKSIGSDKNIELVSIPDGLCPEDDRSVENLTKAILENFPVEIEKLIGTINGNTAIGQRSKSSSSNDKISGVIFYAYLGVSMEVAAKLGIEGVVFCPSSAAILAHSMNLPNLICDGILNDYDGTPTQKQIIQLSSGMPGMDTSWLPWKFDDLASQKIVFQLFLKVGQALKAAQWCLCNTTYDIESVALSSFPNFLPIGPLMTNNINNPLDISGSQFWAEDSSFLSWLDQHKSRSVIYTSHLVVSPSMSNNNFMSYLVG